MAPDRPRRSPRLPAALSALAAALLVAAPTRPAAARETFSIEYVVELRAADPTVARVRWRLAGIDEIRRIRLRTRSTPLADVQASGRLEERDGELIWWPGGPYGRLSYTVPLWQRHAGGPGFVAWATPAWSLIRLRHLFPPSAVVFATGVEPAPEGRARLLLRLPDDTWDVACPLAPDGPRRFVVESPAARFDRPRGWLMLGRFTRTERTIAGTAVTVAAAGRGTTAPGQILGLLDEGLPLLQRLLAHTPPHLLIALAPDPMWRGGQSAGSSFYMHGDRPLRMPDRTSPYLRELFHVLDPLRPGPDAAWITDGLAELYSVEIPRRIGMLDPDAHRRALRSFARHGLWRHDFTRTPDVALRTNSAPLVLWALDQRIRAATDDRRGLDDVVTTLATEGGVVTTARFLGAVRHVAGSDFNAFFRRHVYRGEAPAPP